MDKYLFSLIISLFSMLSVLNAQNSCGPVTDYDGNTYKTVQIGKQCWMAENLRTIHFADGTPISKGTSNTVSYTAAYFYYPDGYASNVAGYGLLYNWPAVMHGKSSSSRNPSGVQGICPDGWHVPSEGEWKELINYVSGQSRFVCGMKNNSIAMALADSKGWEKSDISCSPGKNPLVNNSTGFSVVPAGYFNGFECGHCFWGYEASFWSATESYNKYACYRGLSYDCDTVNYDYGDQVKGYIDVADGSSVRCIRDSEEEKKESRVFSSENQLTNSSNSENDEGNTLFSIDDLMKQNAVSSGSSGGNSTPTSCSTVTDYDGNTYKTVQIGSQCWMAEDLRVTHYEDGTSIPYGDKESNTEAYWTYRGFDVYVYNWAAVMHGAKSSSKNPSGVQGICPKGWHVPSREEWTQLDFYVYEQDKYKSGDNSVAKALSEKWSWDKSPEPRTPGNNQSTNNATGFSAISPDGEYAFFHCSTTDEFDDDITAGFWIYYADSEPSPEGGLFWPISKFGSVRCLRDEKMSNAITPDMLFENNQTETRETSVSPQDRQDNTTENSDEEEIYKFSKEYPEFPGGDDALLDFLRNEIKYPKAAKEKHITGTVLVEFVVEKDGRISNAKVKVPLFPDCDAEAVRAVMAMPKWKPGKNEGKNVRCFYQIPITFSM